MKLVVSIFLLFLGLPAQTGQFLQQERSGQLSENIYHVVSNSQPKDDEQLIDEFVVSGLRVRVATRLSTQSMCSSGRWRFIYIEGPINKDTSFILDRLLLDNPSCINQEGRVISSVVSINSKGGRVQDGFAIGRILRKHRISSVLYDGQTCASACAIAFLGGATRRMFGNSTLIFHAPYSYVPKTFNAIECSDAKSATALLNYYQEMIGISFAQKLFERTMDFCSTSDGWTLDPSAAEFFGILTSNTANTKKPIARNIPTEQWIVANLRTVAEYVNKIFLAYGMSGLADLVERCYASQMGKDYICYMLDRAAMTIDSFNPNPASHIAYFSESAHLRRLNDALRSGIYELDAINAIRNVIDLKMTSILLEELKTR